MKRVTSFLAILLLLTSLLPLTAAAELQERDRRAVQSYQDVRARYMRQLEAYKSARQDFLAARARFRARRNASNANITFEREKTFLLRADEAMIGHIEVIEARIKSTDLLPDEEKNSILEELDSYIDWLESRRGEIEAAETEEELLEIARAVREKWSEIRVTVKRIAGQLLSARIDRIIERSEALSERLDAKIQELKDRGADTAELERLLEDFNEKLALAEQKNNAAKESFKQIKSLRDADRLFRQGHGFIREASLYLREAYRDLKEIVREMRSSDMEDEG